MLIFITGVISLKGLNQIFLFNDSNFVLKDGSRPLNIWHYSTCFGAKCEP